MSNLIQAAVDHYWVTVYFLGALGMGGLWFAAIMMDAGYEHKDWWMVVLWPLALLLTFLEWLWILVKRGD